MTANAPAHTARFPARGCKRGAVLWIFRLVENTASEPNNPTGVVVFVQLHDCVADRGDAAIQTDSVFHMYPPHEKDDGPPKK